MWRFSLPDSRVFYAVKANPAPDLLSLQPAYRNRGIGTTLVRGAIARARLAGHRAILLVGDASYYGHFGFSAAATGGLWMPGRFERNRLFALELESGALRGVRGMIGPTGQFKPKPDLNALVAASRCTRHAVVRRAA